MRDALVNWYLIAVHSCPSGHVLSCLRLRGLANSYPASFVAHEPQHTRRSGYPTSGDDPICSFVRMSSQPTPSSRARSTNAGHVTKFPKLGHPKHTDKKRNCYYSCACTPCHVFPYHRQYETHFYYASVLILNKWMAPFFVWCVVCVVVYTTSILS